MPPVTITKELVKLCADFASKSDVSYYAANGQANEQRVREQIRDGKVGEHVCYHSLKHLGTISAPDLRIYKLNERSWNADLILRDVKEVPFLVHVKTQTKEAAKKLGVSWCFSSRDKEIFGNERKKRQLVAFVQIEMGQDETRQGEVVALVPLEKLHQLNCFDEPKRESLRATKRVVYFDKLKQVGLVKGNK